jgi:hypothetical protein
MADWEGFPVDIGALRRVFDLLVTHVSSNSGPTVTIKEDYYWSIERSLRLNPYVVPAEFTVGQLTDNWQTLQSMNDSNVISYGLVWLAEVLREIGESNPC